MKAEGIVIIIPAYKESKNIPLLLEKIYKTLPQAQVIIVDDSPEKEHTKLEKVLKKQRKDVVLLTRSSKMGRGSAVLFGLSYALKDQHLQYFFEMDADLAHNPQELPLFLENRDKADLIIGSRYLTQSRIIKWTPRRIIMSKMINFGLRVWLGLHLSDYTNGYRMYSRKAVQFLTKQDLRESGFIALSESAYLLKTHGFRIIEIPTTFTDRKYGQSNAGFKELIMSLVGAIKLRFRN